MVNIRYFIVVLAVVLFVGMASADFEVGNASHSIEGVYGPLQDIRGWMNISLSDEDANSLLEDTQDNSIELIDLLEKRSYSYSCNPVDCSSDYTASNGETSKTFSMEGDGYKILGLRFLGSLSSVNSLDFNLQSNAPVSCKNQIKIDVLDDDIIEFSNNKTAEGGGCSDLRNYGCYNAELDTEEYMITTAPYCQRMNLSEFPGFTLGAWIKKVSGTMDIAMSLYNDNNDEVASCDLPDITGSEGETSCNVSYSVTETEEYYVCIYAAGGTGLYKIRGNSNPTSGCGFYDKPPPSSTPAAYEIFAEGRKFDVVGTLSISDSPPSGETLGDIVHDYLLEKYGSELDCSTECVVPIKFISGISQEVTIDNLVVNYQKESGIVTEDRFYDLTEIPSKITSDFQKIYLSEGGFSVPASLGDYDFSLSLDGNKIFSEKVRIEDVPQIASLTPVSTASAYPTEFKVGINSSAEIEKYFWDFGDNKTDITTINKATHTYSSTGSYDLTITVTDSREFTNSRTFNINVSLPKDLINTTLKEMSDNIDNIKIQIADFDFFSQESLNSILKIDNVSTRLGELETAFNAAVSEAEYNQIITELLLLEMPKSVSESTRAESISFFPESKNINMDILQTIGGGSYDSNREDAYSDAVILWNQENLEVKIDFIDFVGEYETFTKSILKVFSLEIKEKKDIGYNYFFILPELENLEFETNVLAEEEGGYVYVDLSGEQKISFSTTEDVDFTNLPAFISPGISRLSVSEPGSLEEEEKKGKLTIFILAISLLIIAAFITYMVLQEWYKRKYEAYLFKNKNDLYNMVTYVNNSKKKGLKNKEISENLGKAKWSSEQIKYVMRKYAGKRTGMFELPVTGLIKKVKKSGVSEKTR